ncbi:hypothetical protein ACLIWF_17970 [Proteus mirabilis]|uniref:hypothetical protein n=1 Tax=Proteus mirabilis TaxID=584 RepID=UPI003A810DA7
MVIYLFSALCQCSVVFVCNRCFLADEQPMLGHKFLCYKKSMIAYRATPMMVLLPLIAVAEY